MLIQAQRSLQMEVVEWEWCGAALYILESIMFNTKMVFIINPSLICRHMKSKWVVIS